MKKNKLLKYKKIIFNNKGQICFIKVNASNKTNKFYNYLLNKSL